MKTHVDERLDVPIDSGKRSFMEILECYRHRGNDATNMVDQRKEARVFSHVPLREHHRVVTNKSAAQ